MSLGSGTSNNEMHPEATSDLPASPRPAQTLPALGTERTYRVRANYCLCALFFRDRNKISILYILYIVQSGGQTKDGWDGELDEKSNNTKWSFPGALLYTLTVITTIGLHMSSAFIFALQLFTHTHTHLEAYTVNQCSRPSASCSRGDGDIFFLLFLIQVRRRVCVCGCVARRGARGAHFRAAARMCPY